jgi:hypothetical protein
MTSGPYSFELESQMPASANGFANESEQDGLKGDGGG